MNRALRPLLVSLHRWFGLASALFLFVAGLTGAIISWDHELDEWLNPQLFRAQTAGQPLPVLELAQRVERADPRAQVRFMPLEIEPGHALNVFVQPRIDPSTGMPYELGYNQVALDPVSGQIQGRREWGAISLDRENLLPFLYKLHYTLHIPDGFGLELGVWLMGLIAIGWVVDCLVSLWISFPTYSTWKKSFAFRWRAGGHKLTFDLHRSGGVWIWLLLLILAVTSVAMNLREPVMRPVVSWFSDLSPSPFASRTPAPLTQPIEPLVPIQRIVAAAKAEARRMAIRDPAGGIFLSTQYGVYGVGFYPIGNGHGDGGLGNPWFYFDSRTGAPAGADIPGTGTAGDIFMQAMFPLHSGRIIGLPGRVIMSLTGLAVATLSVTGILIWLRKRRARARTSVERVRLMQRSGGSEAIA